MTYKFSQEIFYRIENYWKILVVSPRIFINEGKSNFSLMSSGREGQSGIDSKIFESPNLFL